MPLTVQQGHGGDASMHLLRKRECCLRLLLPKAVLGRVRWAAMQVLRCRVDPAGCHRRGPNLNRREKKQSEAFS